MSTTAHPENTPAPASGTPAARQFVNFMFFHTDRAFRSLPEETKAEAKREFAEIIRSYSDRMMVLPYSTLGLKAGADFMLWRIG